MTSLEVCSGPCDFLLLVTFICERTRELDNQEDKKCKRKTGIINSCRNNEMIRWSSRGSLEPCQNLYEILYNPFRKLFSIRCWNRMSGRCTREAIHTSNIVRLQHASVLPWIRSRCLPMSFNSLRNSGCWLHIESSCRKTKFSKCLLPVSIRFQSRVAGTFYASHFYTDINQINWVEADLLKMFLHGH